jgi:general stress protein 26
MPVNAVLIGMTPHRSKQGSRGKTMLSPEMKQLIVSHTAGMVGTVDDAGKPAVSPKATFFIVDDATIAYGDIRSPGTRRNIAKRPAVEVNFIDVVYRKAVRVTGTATFIAKSDADVTLLEKFSAEWPNLVSVVSGFVKIKIHAAKMIFAGLRSRCNGRRTPCGKPGQIECALVRPQTRSRPCKRLRTPKTQRLRLRGIQL